MPHVWNLFLGILVCLLVKEQFHETIVHRHKFLFVVYRAEQLLTVFFLYPRRNTLARYIPS